MLPLNFMIQTRLQCSLFVLALTTEIFLKSFSALLGRKHSRLTQD